MKLKIFHLISSLEIGGAQMALCRLVSKIDRQSFENNVVSLINVGPIGRMFRDLGVSVHSLAMRRGQPSPVGLWRLVKLLRREPPDILQIEMDPSRIK